jgi:uncharacterized Rossmann fold enzyme
LPKIDKSQYTKQQWKIVREERRNKKRERLIRENTVPLNTLLQTANKGKIGFVLGNGTSRSSIDVQELQQQGKTYACNAVYRNGITPDYLVAVDTKMILEITSTGYQNNNIVYTNPNKSYSGIKNLNFFNPSKGWSSGPTALWLAAQHGYEKIYILGFDYKGLDDGKRLNNIFANTRNYKKSTDGATFFGNWMRQTIAVLRENPHIEFNRIILPDNYIPDELNTFNNMKHMLVDDFKEIFNLS